MTLYRDCLRGARRFDNEHSRLTAIQFVRIEFRRGASTVEKLDIQRIEHLLRQSKKKLELYSMPGVTGFESSLPSSPTGKVVDASELPRAVQLLAGTLSRPNQLYMAAGTRAESAVLV